MATQGYRFDDLAVVDLETGRYLSFVL
jgi:hypothetical protein